MTSRKNAKAAGTRAENMFCRRADLDNEASVETFFASRLLEYLRYKDRQIRSKSAVEELAVSRGRKRASYRPDYALVVKGKVRWVLDAKAVREDLDDWAGQCASYCLELNKRDASEDPARYFALTNGAEFRVYEWNQDAPKLTLSFGDFQEGNPRLAMLVELLGAPQLARALREEREAPAQAATLTLTRPSIEDVNAVFNWCYQHIHKKDNLSQAAAFTEFVKVVFLKLLSDKDLRDKHPDAPADEPLTVPASDVKFSIEWIKSREADHVNPLDIQFQALKESLEVAYTRGEKKRIFEPSDKIKLTPETIKGVTERLERLFLLGIDADLNGRLFETFLSATMRGKDLGQYFTPRSVVKLTVALANPIATREHVDSVLDPCCGSGGFLIEVLSRMEKQIRTNDSLTETERKRLWTKITKERIYGIDVGEDPPVARIARINMYLHGDGGSSIFQADGLDKRMQPPATASAEQKREVSDLREAVENKDGFDLIITNPPFAKEYERRHGPENAVLDEYDSGFAGFGRTGRPLPSVPSRLLFLERYYDFLRPGGRAWAIVDDSILGGDEYREARNYLRAKYLIRAVISLPGDAFQRSNARVKTSIICLERRSNQAEAQPPAFMHYCTSVGIDDPRRKRTLPIDRENRAKATAEIERIVGLWQAFQRGEGVAKPWTVSAEKLMDRLDVKGCLVKPGRLVKSWRRDGLGVKTLGDLATVRVPPESDTIDCKETDDEVTFLVVGYDGMARPGDTKPASESNYAQLYRVREGDIIISHINAVSGAVAVIGPESDGLVVSNEYTILNARPGLDPKIIWALLRSPESRSDLLILASGIGRHRVKWENASALDLPEPPPAVARFVIAELEKADQMERDAAAARRAVSERLNNEFGLDNPRAVEILRAFKPPK